MSINRLFPFFRRLNRNTIHPTHKLVTSNVHPSSKEKEGEDVDAPVKYTSSPARKWKAEASRMGYVSDRLWYEPYVILASVTIFLVYFGLLREQNDIDEELNKSLYSRIEGLEEHQLRMSLEYNREHNLDTTQIIQRLEELEREKTQTVNKI